MTTTPLLEVIVLDVADAQAAEAAGVDRLEVVSAIDVGGLTPTADVLAAIVRSCKLPAMVMVRPHARSFVYDDADMRQVREAIAMVRGVGAHGVVFGALTRRGEIDRYRLDQVIGWAQGLSITFHRAFDAAADLDAAYSALDERRAAVAQVLTSGGHATAPEGCDALRQLLGRGGGVDVLVGSGVTADTLAPLHAALGARQYHVGGGARRGGRFDAALDPERLLALRGILADDGDGAQRAVQGATNT